MSRSGYLLLAAVVVAAGAGCARNAPLPEPPDLVSWGNPDNLPELNPQAYASSSPGKVWNTAPGLGPEPRPVEPLRGVSPELADVADRLTLPQLVDAALKNNPSTRQTWEQARAAVAAWGKARGLNYPQLEGYVAGGWYDSGASKGVNDFFQRGIVAGVTLDWLLLDFGGRKATIEEARQAFFAASWNHNQAIQDLIRDVRQAYQMHVGAQAELRASEISLQQAQTNLDSAQAKRKAGTATIADVLQAKASVAQRRVDLEAKRGAVQTSHGALATVVGWPVNAKFGVVEEAHELPLAILDENVDRLIEQARRHRPDLGAVWATVRAREAEVRKAESAHWPQISASANVEQEAVSGTFSDDSVNHFGLFSLKVPLFEGFALNNAVREARRQLDATRAALELQENAVIQSVWNAYVDYRTAVDTLRGTEELLASAEESYEVALGRYRAGAGDVVELLRAQSTLADARARIVRARTDVFTVYAELVHAIGAEPAPSDRTVEGTPEPRSDKYAGTFKLDQSLSH